MKNTKLRNCRDCKIRMKSVLCDLQDDEVSSLNSSKRGMFFKKGQAICHEDSYPQNVYCITEGMVKLIQTGTDGKEQIVHFTSEGDTIGYREVLGGDMYSSSAVAMEDSAMCSIPRALFISYVRKNPKVSFKVIQRFSKELETAERKIISITQKPVPERIAQSLLLLEESYGYEDDGMTLNIILKRDELANIAGTTRETATRFLRTFERMKIIELTGKKIKILDNGKLKKSARLQK